MDNVRFPYEQYTMTVLSWTVNVRVTNVGYQYGCVVTVRCKHNARTLYQYGQRTNNMWFVYTLYDS